MSKKTIILILSLVIVAAVILVYFLALRPREADRPVKTGYLPLVANLPAYAAVEKDYFAARKVEVEVTEINSSNDILNAIIAGRLDIVPSLSIVPVLHLEIQNPGVARIFAIAYTSQDNAMDSIIVKQDSPIESLTELAGKKVGLFPGTTATNLLRALLKREGVDTSSTTFVPLPPPAQVGALAAGAIDALFSYEPVTTIAMATGGFRTVYGSVFNSFLDPNPIGVAVISRRFEREHPKLAKRAIEAFLEGAQFVFDQPNEARKLLTKFLKIPPPIADQVHLIGLKAVTKEDIESLQKLINILNEIGELPKTLDAKELVASGK